MPPPINARALISLGRNSRKWRRFAVLGSGFLSYTPRVTITDPPNYYECKDPPKVKSDTLLLVFARPVQHVIRVGDTEDLTFTVTNAPSGQLKALGGLTIVYDDDDDPPSPAPPHPRPRRRRRPAPPAREAAAK